MTSPPGPLIVQSDGSILLDAHHARHEEARDTLVRFAELIKSPEHVHTYQITPLSLWNAAATGIGAAEVLRALDDLGQFPVPQNVRATIADHLSRFGRLRLVRIDGGYALESNDASLLAEIERHPKVVPFLRGRIAPDRIAIDPMRRGHVKQALVKVGWPAEDLAGYVDGAPLEVALREQTQAGLPFVLRDYQRQAVDAFHAGGDPRGGCGVITLPCGAGKTIVGMAALARLRCRALILATSTVAVRQWRRELLDKTTLAPDEIGEYTGHAKEIRPVTLATYQIVTYRARGTEDYPHFALFHQHPWGLIVYDEVHLLPAPIFRITAELQARRRLGLTATLVREDGLEDDVFSLIGPKKYDVPWRALEGQGWIAPADCTEIRVPLPPPVRMAYATAEEVHRFRIAAENPLKPALVREVLARHAGTPALVIGQFLTQVARIAEELSAPLIMGQTPLREREKLLDGFRRGDIPLLVLSKVGNFSIDLPEAALLVQVSGTFGSRQEEAQRLGRILRPKADRGTAHFYTLVSRETKEEDFATKRQLFLAEQGYRYRLFHAETWRAEAEAPLSTTT